MCSCTNPLLYNVLYNALSASSQDGTCVEIRHRTDGKLHNPRRPKETAGVSLTTIRYLNLQIIVH